MTCNTIQVKNFGSDTDDVGDDVDIFTDDTYTYGWE